MGWGPCMGADGFTFWLPGSVWRGWPWPGGSGPQCLIRVAGAPEWVLGGRVPQKDRLPPGVDAWGGGWCCCFLEPLYLIPAGKQARPGIWHPFIGVGPGGGLGAWGFGGRAPQWPWSRGGRQVQAVPWLPWRPAPTAVALGWVPVSGLKSAPPAQACPGTWQRGAGINTGKLEGLPELTRSLQLQVKGMRERFVLRSGCAGAVGRQWAVS